GNNDESYGESVFGKEGNIDGLVSYNRNDEKDYEAGKGFRNDNGGKPVPYSALDKRSYLPKIGTTFGDDDHRIVLSHMKDQHRGIRTVREEFAVSEKNSRITIKRQAPSCRETTQSNTSLAYTGKDLGFVEKLDANAYVL
ncbi:TonB-dependent siderophore receptor, partial [Salmonella enterica subsp. enterica serovar Muenchen]